jgi:hypothetical protein
MDASIVVHNTLGAVVMNQAVSLSGNYRLDISALKPGIYFIRVSSADAQQTLKLIVE